jgi:hypothetical protein
LLEIAALYELEARLVDASAQAIVESKRLIAEADNLWGGKFTSLLS